MLPASDPALVPEGFPGQRLVIIPPKIVVSAARQPILRDLCITHIGAFSASPHHYVSRSHGTSQHILIACLAGQGHCRVNGQDWHLSAGSLLFLPPRMLHTYAANPKAPWTIFWIHFRGQRATDYLESLGVSSRRPVLHVDNPEALADAFEDTFRHTNHGFSEASMMGLSTSFSRLLGLAKVHQRSCGNRSLKTETRLIKTLTLIRDNPAHPWNLREMANMAGMSIPHFTELCRKQTGMPPTTYLIRLRLQRAMDILIREQLNVAETARAVGYDDPFYFSRLFRKHMGIPPSSILREPQP